MKKRLRIKVRLTPHYQLTKKEGIGILTKSHGCSGSGTPGCGPSCGGGCKG